MSVNEWEGGSLMLCKLNQIQRIGVSHDSRIYTYLKLCSMTLKTTAAAAHNLKTFNTSVEISNEMIPTVFSRWITIIQHLCSYIYWMVPMEANQFHCYSSFVCKPLTHSFGCVCWIIKKIKITKELGNWKLTWTNSCRSVGNFCGKVLAKIA